MEGLTRSLRLLHGNPCARTPPVAATASLATFASSFNKRSFKVHPKTSFSSSLSSAFSSARAMAPGVVAAADGSASAEPLFTPYHMRASESDPGFQLSLRMVYPPLTRDRALGTVPQPNMAIYYSQRAHDGSLMISEGTCISLEAHGYPNTPGVYTAEQLEAWKPIIKAVHDKGAFLFCQLWHCGRASHMEYQPDGRPPPSSSAVPIVDDYLKVYISTGPADYPVPREMTTEEIKSTVEDYRKAARNAIDAGFDGVEIHGGNGYLIENFIKNGTNKRTDEYGGSIENRIRFPLEVAKAVVDEVGAGKVGIRLSPYSNFLNSEDTDVKAVYLPLVKELSSLGLLYLHMVEGRVKGIIDVEDNEKETLDIFRSEFKNTFIAAGGFKYESGNQAVANGHADLVAYGRLWLSNPDLPERFKQGATLNKYDRNTFYTSDQVVGYIDYPFLDEAAAKAT